MGGMLLTDENGNTEGKTSFCVTPLPSRIPVVFLVICQYSAVRFLGTARNSADCRPL